jgi:hypothetical protein
LQNCISSERALTDKDKLESYDDGSSLPSERYTIFHALFEALKENDKKRKKK